MIRSTAPHAMDSGAAAAPRPISVEAYPAPGSIFLWRVVVRRGPGERDRVAGVDQAGGVWLVARVRPWYGPDDVERLWHRASEANDPWPRRATSWQMLRDAWADLWDP